MVVEQTLTQTTIFISLMQIMEGIWREYLEGNKSVVIVE